MRALDLLSNDSIADFKGNALLLKAATLLEDKVKRINGIPGNLKSGFGALIAVFKDESTPEAARQKIRKLLEQELDGQVDVLKSRVLEYVKNAEKLGIGLPENWEDFTRQVRDFQGNAAEIDWELFDLGGSRSLDKSDQHNLALAGSSGAELNFGAGIALPVEITKAPASQQLEVEDVISLGVSGNLEGKLAAAIPLLTMEGKANRSVDLDYYFKASAEERLGLAAARAMSELVSPFDLGDIRSNESLLALRYENRHGFKFGTNFQLEKGFDFLDMDAGLSVSIAGSVLREGGTEIVTWNKGNRVFVAIERSDKNTEVTTVGLKAGLDLSALVSRVNLLLKEVQGDYKALLTRFDKFTQPGKLIKQQISEAWQESDNLNSEEKSLVLSLIGFDAGKSAEESLTDFLEAKVLTHRSALDDDVDEAASKVAAEVFATLGIDSSKEAELQGKINKVLDKGLDGIQKELDKRITEVVGGELSKKTLEALEKHGAEIAGLPANVDKRVQRLAQPIREVLQKYYDVLGKIVKATSDTTKARLELELAMEESSTDGNKIDLLVEFSQFDDAQNHAYEELIRGSFDAVYALIRDGVEGVKTGGKLKDFVQRKTTSSLQVSFLGFDLGSTSIIDVATELEIDTNTADGSITVTSKSQLDKQYDPLIANEVRKLRFTSLMTLAASAQNPAVTNVFRLWHEDENLKRKEVRRFLKGLQQADLLPPNTYREVLDEFDDYIEANDDQVPAGQLTIGFDLKHKHIKSLLKLDLSKPQFNAQEAAYKEVVARNLASVGMKPRERAALIKTMKSVLSNGRKLFRDVDIRDDNATIEPTMKIIQMMNRTQFKAFLSLRSDGRKHDYRRIQGAYRHNTLIDAYWQTLVIMREVYFRAKNLKPSSNRNTELAFFNQKQSELAQHHSRWLKLNKGLFGIPDEVREETVAYVRSQMDLITGAPRLFARISFN